MNPLMRASIAQAKKLSKKIDIERQETLLQISQYIEESISEKNIAELIFVCTHNSRRSHLGQVWASIMAEEFGIKGVQTFSGGTEATACHPNTLAALTAQGVDVKTGEGENPLQTLSWGTENEAHCWSKIYNDAKNPQADFCAIMTCGSADKGCPIIAGCELRVPCTYVDPKVSDGTPEQDATYQERSLQIASEMAWVMQKVDLQS